MRKRENDSRSVLRIAETTAACLLLFAWSAAAQSAKPVKLECESLVTPLGMDTAKPQLSWKMEDSRSGARQTAYQIQVASKAEILAGGKGDVWDSGRVESDNSPGVNYGGPALEPSKRYYWRVLVWDKDGKAVLPAIRAGGRRDFCSRKTGRRSGLATKNPNCDGCANRARSGSRTPKGKHQKRPHNEACISIPF